MRLRAVVVSLAAAVLAACNASEKTQQATLPSRVERSDTLPSDGLTWLRGPGFVLSVPREALVEHPTDSTWAISAPRQLVRAGIGTADTTQFENDIPLYQFGVTVRHKPATQTLVAWGDSLIKLENADADFDRATGRTVGAAGQTAYLREPYCGDCGVYIYCFARDTQVVEIEYTLSTNEPLGVRKRGVYALLLSTFRWVQ